MCDTLAIVAAGQVLFAKNSDRDPNEAQLLEWHPRRSHAAGAILRCTHVELPQVERTWAVLLSRPFWMWGAEMGANEHGVVIGNEAVFTKQPTSKTGLTGMDLLRLALERARNAREAAELIVALIAAYGQGGSCSLEHPGFTYHNSFILADPAGALVLETAGRKWALEPIEGARSISNGLTIPGFAQRHSDWLKTAVSASRIRRARTEELARDVGDVRGMAAILRDHGDAVWPRYRRLNGSLRMPCMHGGSEIASSLTTGSWISRRGPQGVRHWVTGSSSPCLSLFKPVSVERPLDLGPPSADGADDSLWWRHERLHRRVMRDPARLAPVFLAERDALEASWFSHPPDSAEAFAEHRRLIEAWLGRIEAGAQDQRPGFVRRYWGRRDRRAGLR